MARLKNSTSGEDSNTKQAEPLATRLRELLTDIGQVRQALGVSSQAINQWKIWESRPSLENLCKIADMYNVSTDYLLGRTEVKSPDTSIQAVAQTIGLSESAVLKLREFVEHPISIMEPEGCGFECLGLEVLVQSIQFNCLLVDIAYFYKSVMNDFEIDTLPTTEWEGRVEEYFFPRVTLWQMNIGPPEHLGGFLTKLEGGLSMASIREKTNKSGKRFYEICVSRRRGQSYLSTRW